MTLFKIDSIMVKKIRCLTVIDEYTRECLAIKVERKLNSQNVLEVLHRLFLSKGTNIFEVIMVQSLQQRCFKNGWQELK